MFESKKNVPRTYARSRHYRALLKLHDIIANSARSDSSNFVDILNPDRCPDRYLHLLASKVGYDYDYNLSYDANRVIIKYFPHMIKLRGSERGIKMAAALSISLYTDMDVSTATSLVGIVYETLNGKDIVTIYLYFPRYSDKIFDLVDLVIPIGLGYRLQSSALARREETLLVEAPTASVLSEVFMDSDRYKVSESNDVGHGEVIKVFEAYYNSADHLFYRQYDGGVYSDKINDPSINILYYDKTSNKYYKYDNGYTIYNNGM